MRNRLGLVTRNAVCDYEYCSQTLPELQTLYRLAKSKAAFA
jgi:hypothetical protein